jgi:hypothetical protein
MLGVDLQTPADIYLEGPMRKGSRTEYMYEQRVTYAAIATGIREGKIACHLDDGKVLIDFDEADEYFRQKKIAKLGTYQNLFA